VNVENAGRARRGRRFAFRNLALALVAALAMPAAASAQVDANLVQLRYTDLIGIWSCKGTDQTGAAFTSTLEWGFNDTGEFFLNAYPKPATPLHPVIDESWLYDTDAVGYYWRAVPDAGAEDPATWITRGWTGASLRFVRLSDVTPMSRTFTRTGPSRLIYRQVAGNRVAFTLSCLRTLDRAPR
jgi:hypothetical protein